MSKIKKNLSMVLFAASAWMVGAVVFSAHHARGMSGDLVGMASCLFITQAYADDSKSGDDGKSDDNEAKSSDDESKSSSSSSYDFSSATLVCVSKSSVESTLGTSSGSESSKSEDESSKSDDEDSKSGKDTSSDSSDDSSSGKVTICHVPPGNEDNPQTLSVAASAVDWHLSNHPGDHTGACEGSDDSGSKSDDGSSKSDDDSSKSSGSTSSSSTSSVDALPSCTALGDNGSADGVWVPDSAVGDSAALTAYIDQVQGGGSSLPDNALQDYREIRGQ